MYTDLYTSSWCGVELVDTPTCTHALTHMKGTLTEPLIRPVSPEFSEEATPKKDGSSVHAHHQTPQFGHHGLPSKDYEVCTNNFDLNIICLSSCYEFSSYVRNKSAFESKICLVFLFFFPQSLDYDICYNVPYKENLRGYRKRVSLLIQSKKIISNIFPLYF